MPSSARPWIISLSIIGLLVGIGVIWLPPNFGQLRQAITPQPEAFTELYFEDHLALPKIASASTPLKVSFTVRNLEHRQVTYPVEVFGQDEATPPQLFPLLKTEFTLDHDQAKTVPVEFALPAVTTPRQKVTVRLGNLDQTIHFWITMPATATATASAKPAAKPARAPIPENILFE